MKDVYSVVDSFFDSWLNVGFYVAAMAFLGSHLFHGVWSAFQSLGLTRVSNLKKVHTGGVVFGILLAIGFLGVPILVKILPAPESSHADAGHQAPAISAPVTPGGAS